MPGVWNNTTLSWISLGVSEAGPTDRLHRDRLSRVQVEGLCVDYEKHVMGCHYLARRITRIQIGDGEGNGNHGGKSGSSACVDVS